MVQGDFGTSFYYNAPVADIIWEKFGNTMVLMIVAIAVAYGIGIPLGAWLSCAAAGLPIRWASSWA